MAMKSTVVTQHLQQDLDKPAIWERTCQMAFLPDKYTCTPCTSVEIKKNPIKFNYTSHCHLLESPGGAKYLGQTIRPDLKGRARKNCRYQRGNQKTKIEGQTKQWPKRKERKSDRHITTQKAKD